MAQQKEISSTYQLLHIPFGIVVEILSWLPVESLLRFKCVRKQWFSLIDRRCNNSFIEKQSVRGGHSLLHYYQTKPDLDYLVPISREDFKYVAFSGGLCLERGVDSPLVARIRNPATHRVFYLPEAHKDTIGFAFACNPFNAECKVVCAYRIKYDGYEEFAFKACGGVGFDVLTVGKDEQWRQLKHPNQNKYLEGGKPYGVAYPETCESLGVCHAFVVAMDGFDYLYVEVYHLDVLSESFTINTLNYGTGISDLFDIRYFIWDGRLALSEITDENLIIVFVLEDFKEHKWSQIKIIPLEFLKNDPSLKNEENDIFCIYPMESFYNELLFYKDEDGTFLLHDVETNSTQLIELEQVAEEKLSPLKSSLVSIEGMEPE